MGEISHCNLILKSDTYHMNASTMVLNQLLNSLAAIL